jgi:hypothetical protein
MDRLGVRTGAFHVNWWLCYQPLTKHFITGENQVSLEITDLFTNMSIFVVVATCGGALLSVFLTVGIIIFVRRIINKTVGLNRSILQNGVPAQAKIRGLWQKGMMLNNHPQVEFDLDVRPPGGTSYRAQAKAIIPMILIPRFQPGVDIPVKINPSDPAQVALDIYL